MMHKACQRNVRIEDRTVQSSPRDRVWPRETIVRVPFCPTCQMVVDVDAVDWTYSKP